MRTLTMLMALVTALLVNLMYVQPSGAETTAERNAVHRKYQTSPDLQHGRSNPWQNEARYEHRRDRANDRRGERIAWRDYHGYTAKHYRIQEHYGGYSAAAAFRADYEYRSERRNNRGNRRGSCNSSRGRR